MDVTVEVVGEGERDCTVAEDATYADLIRAAGYHPQEASVLVDGSPVPGDGAVDADRVRLLRLVKGGDGSAATGGDRDLPAGVRVEPAAPADRLDVLRVLDAAMLETDADRVAERIAAGDVLVARRESGAVLGALVATRPDGENRGHVDAVAVRRERRGRGIGSALVATLVDRAESDPALDAVTAAFDASLAGFYTDLGFAVEPAAGDGRRRGRRSVDDGRERDGIAR